MLLYRIASHFTTLSYLCVRDPAEDILEPQLEPAEQEAVSLHRRQTVLAHVEADEVERPLGDEEVVRLVEVDVSAAVEAPERRVVELDVLHVHTLRLLGRLRPRDHPEGSLQGLQGTRMSLVKCQSQLLYRWYLEVPRFGLRQLH